MILKADDYGNQPSANRGIYELVKLGRLSSVGAMISFTGPQEALELQKAISQSPLTYVVSTVLHVNFQSGRPVASPEKVLSLIDSNGQFLKPEPVARAWRDYSQAIDPEHVKIELSAQIEQFYKVFGKYPDALDSHNVILAIPPVADIAMIMAQELKIPITFPYLYAESFGPGPLAAQLVHTELKEEYKRRGIATADQTFPDDNGMHIYLNSLSLEAGINLLQRGLNNLQPGVTQIVFHPVHIDEARIPTDSEEIDMARKRDYSMLINSEVGKTIENLRREKRITSYKNLT